MFHTTEPAASPGRALAPCPPVTIARAIEAAAAGDDGTWYVTGSGDEVFESYATLFDRVQRLAGALRRRGLQPGERVALILDEPAAFLPAFLGASVATLVPVPLPPRSPLQERQDYREQTARVLRASGAALLLTSTGTAASVAGLRNDVPELRDVIDSEQLDGPPLTGRSRHDLRDVALVQFTSGSTRRPRGVLVTHANLWTNIQAFAGPSGLAVVPEDRGVSWLPLWHDMGLIGTALAPIFLGITSVLMSPLLFLKRPASWLRAMSRHRATISFAPTFAYELCARRVRDTEVSRLNLSRWRVAGCGAEPVRCDSLDRFARLFAPAGFRAESFLPCYGLAEHTLAATLCRAGRGIRTDLISRRALLDDRIAQPCAERDGGAIAVVSCGRALPGHTVAIVDAGGRLLPERQVGEIVLSGPSVAGGYAGAASEPVSDDGRLHTGDLGYLADAELFICGRLKDVIIVNGRNHHADDLETIAGGVAGVRHGRVVAFAVDGLDAAERAVVVAEEDGTVEPQDVADAIASRIEQVSGLLINRAIVVARGTLPRTTSGKLQRSKTRDLLLIGALVAAR